MSSEIIKIGKCDFNIETKFIPLNDLKFYTENPRLHSEMSQDDIFSLFSEMEHVQQLKLSIFCNGGVIEPLFVRDGDFVVLDGNSRLAAYRLLAQDEPDNWNSVPCKLLPASLDEKTIFALLGQIHIIGRKDWEPFEQANYLYQRQQKTNIPVKQMAAELGISTKSANKYIKTIEFMIHHDDLNEKHWNCYDKYLKDSSIKKMRETESELDNTVVEAIKSESIKESKDMKLLTETAKVAVEGDEEAQTVMKQIATGKTTIYDGHATIENSGKFEDVVQKLRKFNCDIDKEGFENQLTTLTDTEQLIERIDRIIERLNTFRASLLKSADEAK